MEGLLQGLEIIFEVQRKRNNEKIARKKSAFQLIKHVFFRFGTLLLSNFITFFISYSFKTI